MGKKVKRKKYACMPHNRVHSRDTLINHSLTEPILNRLRKIVHDGVLFRLYIIYSPLTLNPSGM
jgi:hypothetical protein